MGMFDLKFLRRRRPATIVQPNVQHPVEVAPEPRRPHLINTYRGFVAGRNPNNMRFTPDARRAATFATFHGADAFAKKFVVEQHLGDKPHYAILISA